MEITKDTKLKDILKAYPWLVDEAVRADERLKPLKSPLGRMLLKRADIAEAGRRTGLDPDVIIRKIEEMVREHRDADQ